MKDNISEYLNTEENYSIFKSIDDKIIDPLRFFQLLEQAEKICMNIDLPHIVKKKYYSFLSEELPGINENNGNDFKIGHLIATHLTRRLDYNLSENWMFKEIKKIPFSIIQDIVEKNVIISIPKTGISLRLNPEKINEKQHSSTNVQIDLEGIIKEIVTIISESCKEIITSPEYYQILKNHSGDLENRRTWLITNKFNDKAQKFHIENQHPTGQSRTKHSTGTVDFAIYFNKNKIVIGEALNFSGQNTKSVDQNIINHLKKLTKNYNQSTLSNLILFVYYGTNSGKFQESFENYLTHFKNCPHLGFKCRKTIMEITSDYVFNSASVKIAKSTHYYSNNSTDEFSIYHFYLNFPENSL